MELTKNIRNWAVCSNLCLLRKDCKYWTYHHSGGHSGECRTMADADGSNIDWVCDSGTREECQGKSFVLV